MKKTILLLGASLIIISNYYTNPVLVSERAEVKRIAELQAYENAVQSRLAAQLSEYDPHYQKDNLTFVWAILGGWGDVLTTKDKVTLSRIAFCESRHVVQAKNVNKNKSKDGGLWQINTQHEKNFELLLDPHYNAQKAVDLYLKNGTTDWRFSSHCWKPLEKKDIL